MTIETWRVVNKKFAIRAFSGEGSYLYGGRWSQRGLRVVSTAESISLVLLELMVNVDCDHLLEHYSLFRVKIPETLVVQASSLAKLPHDWRQEPAPDSTRPIGGDWIRSGQSAVLQVPSSMVPSESNFVLNLAHQDYSRIEIGKSEETFLDPRLRTHHGLRQAHISQKHD